MHQRARTDPSGGRGATRVPTGTQGNADLVLLVIPVPVGYIQTDNLWRAAVANKHGSVARIRRGDFWS